MEVKEAVKTAKEYIFIDANLLILLIVGRVGEEFISRHGRLQSSPRFRNELSVGADRCVRPMRLPRFIKQFSGGYRAGWVDTWVRPYKGY